MHWKRWAAVLGAALLGIALAAAPRVATAGHHHQKSLYERLGGVQAIAAVVDDMVDRLLKDPVITANPRTVEGMKHVTVPGLKYQITAFLCQAAGGPEKYTGKDMLAAHKGLRISDEEWDAGAKDVKATLDKFHVPDAEQQEIFALVGSIKKDIVGQ